MESADYMHVYIHKYICIYREKERAREKEIETE